MKRIEVNGSTNTRDMAIVIIPRWMVYSEVIAFLEGMGLEAGTDEDLRAYHAQYPEGLRGKWTAAIGNSKEGKSLCYNDYFECSGIGFRETNTEQQYLMGCSFIAIFPNNRSENPVEQYQPAIIEKKVFEIDGKTKTAAIIPFSRWADHREITILLTEKGTNLKVANMEEVKAFFIQHPGDLKRKWVSRGSDRPYAFRQEEDFDDFFTSECVPNTSDMWCGTLVILPE